MDEKILSQLNILLENASDAVRSVILDGHLDEEIVVIINTYHFTVDESVLLKNTVLMTLLGVVSLSEFRNEITKDFPTLDPTTLEALIKDIDTGIFERARIALFGEEYEDGQEMKKLSLGEKESDDVLREQIMANTDRESAIKTSPLELLKKKIEDQKKGIKEDDIVSLGDLVKKAPAPTITKPEEKPAENIVATEPKASTPTGETVKEAVKDDAKLPGSRSELLERLNVLQSIPNSEEVGERMQSIRAQIAKIEENKTSQEKQEDIDYARASLKEKRSVDTTKFPKSYVVDPYREMPD